MIELPITEHLEEIRQGLRSSAALVLEAPPGAGKTTLVPLALLDEPWLADRKILVLEPRRLAAKAAARRMASLLGEPIGQTVGYRVRKDSKVSSATRIEVVTEGILTRMLISDNELSDAACVIFDEFHERSLHADLGLGLTLLTQELARPDLRIVVMSATLASLDLSRLLPNALDVRSAGRTYPIDDTYLKRKDERPLPQLVTAAVKDALREHTGDVLVFLPGIAEIRRCEEALRSVDADVMPLYGDLTPEAQDRILTDHQGAPRRVILATSVAETSVTIPGISTVIDSGLAREPRFDPRSGMTRLITVPVSRDAADQRRGRAGRTGPGHCIRLWTEAEHGDLPARRTPEILSADLTSLVVNLAAYGVTPHDVAWLDAPPDGPLQQSRELLRELEVMDREGQLTPHGADVARMGVHPRLAHMILRSKADGLDAVARQVADRIEEQRRPKGASVELHVGDADPLDIGRCLALAYPDRVARKRSENRYVLRNGRTARIAEHDALARHAYLAIADLGGGSEPWIGMAAPLTEDIVRELFADQVETVVTAGWDERAEHMSAIEEDRLGAIQLRAVPTTNVDEDALAVAFANVLAQRDYRDLPWTRNTEQLRDRILFVRHHTDASTADPLGPETLAPFLVGFRKLKDLKGLNMGAILDAALSWNERQQLDRLAPTIWKTPTGREIRIDYRDPDRPTLSVRLQQMFGVQHTPVIGEARIPLTIQLLSPADRPIQVTTDLAGFWTGSYAEVRKEMRGRYPKHDWPEDPSERPT